MQYLVSGIDDKAGGPFPQSKEHDGRSSSPRRVEGAETMASPSAAPEPRATWREWAGLAVLALPTLMVSLDIFVMLMALPQLSTQLGASSSQQLWIMDVYGFMAAGFMITMGTIGDRIGRRRLLLTGAALFGVASVTAAHASSPQMLIVARAVL